VVTIGADDDVAEIMATMTRHKVRRLPVIDGHDLVGIGRPGRCRPGPTQPAGRRPAGSPVHRLVVTPVSSRRRLAVEQLAEFVPVEKKIKALTAELKQMVKVSGSGLMDLRGVGPVVAARILADVGDVARFADRNRFASWTGTAATTQIRLDTPGRISDALYRRLGTG